MFVFYFPGPGLAFVVYPEAISRMPAPVLWAIFFFIMMATLGFGSMFAVSESVMGAIIDEFSVHLKQRWKSVAFRTSCILFAFCMGLPMVSRVRYLILLLFLLFLFPLMIFSYTSLHIITSFQF